MKMPVENNTSPVRAWRNKDRLKPLKKNPGLFTRMLKRQQEIQNEPRVESNFHRYQAEDEELPKTRE